MSKIVTVQIDDSDLKRLEAKMKACPEATRKAIAVTLGQKRAVSRIITFVADEAIAEYRGVIRKDVKQLAKTKTQKGVTSTSLSIEFKDSPLKATKFPNTISRSKNRSPITLEIKRGIRKKSGTNPVMFGTRPKREIYKRKLGERTIRPVYTLSIPQMISNDEVYKRIQTKAQVYITERLEHELDYRLGLIAKK